MKLSTRKRDQSVNRSRRKSLIYIIHIIVTCGINVQSNELTHCFTSLALTLLAFVVDTGAVYDDAVCSCHSKRRQLLLYFPSSHPRDYLGVFEKPWALTRKVVHALHAGNLRNAFPAAGTTFTLRLPRSVVSMPI